MKTFTFEMKTPEGIFLSEEAEYVCLPSSDGRYGILACHAPVILWLDRGMCEYTQNGVKKRVFILEGVADVNGIAAVDSFFDGDILSFHSRINARNMERLTEKSVVQKEKNQRVNLLKGQTAIQIPQTAPLPMSR